MAGAASKLKRAKQPAKEKGSRPVDYRLGSFTLDVPGSKAFDADIAQAILTAELELTMEGASTLTLTVEDSDGSFLKSGTLVTWVWGKDTNIGKDDKWLRVGRAVDAKLDDINFRLVKVSKAATTLTLTFEERAVGLLRRKKGARKASRAKLTRAQFVQTLIREVKAYGGVKSFIPEAAKKQPIAKAPKKPTKVSDSERSDEGKSGIAKGEKLTVKGKPASAEQKANMQRVLDVAGGAPEKATLALVEACIIESEFHNLSGGEGTSVGILQLIDSHGSVAFRRDIEKVVKLFLDEGFTGKGGAIEIARKNPGMSAGNVAQEVQGSGFPDRYDEVRNEAEKIVSAYSGGGNIGGGSETYTKSYQYARGKDENSWDALGRLADEVRWKRFMRRGKLWFVSENYLFRQRPELKISEGAKGVDWIDFDVDMFARPTSTGTTPVAEVRVQARADLWTALPGMIVAIEDMGVVNGRWLVSSITRSLVDDAEACDITLRKPIPQAPEPAAETGTRGGAGGENAGDTPSGNVSGDIGGVKDALKEFIGLVAGQTSETINISDGLATSGHVPGSDHYQGRAVDIDVGGDAHSDPKARSKGNNIAAAALKVCGLGDHAAREIADQDEKLNFSYEAKWKGNIIVIGWRTLTGGNHFNHVHISLRNRAGAGTHQ